jgi:hypothetical protein
VGCVYLFTRFVHPHIIMPLFWSHQKLVHHLYMCLGLIAVMIYPQQDYDSHEIPYLLSAFVSGRIWRYARFTPLYMPCPL